MVALAIYVQQNPQGNWVAQEGLVDADPPNPDRARSNEIYESLPALIASAEYFASRTSHGFLFPVLSGYGDLIDSVTKKPIGGRICYYCGTTGPALSMCSRCGRFPYFTETSKPRVLTPHEIRKSRTWIVELRFQDKEETEMVRHVAMATNNTAEGVKDWFIQNGIREIISVTKA